MKGKETLSARQALHLPRSFRYSALFAIICSLIYGAWIAFHLSDYSPTGLLIISLGDLLLVLASLFLSLIGSKRPLFKRGGQTPVRSFSWSPRMISVALFCACLANILYGIAYNSKSYVFPSWGDAAILVTYIFFLLSIWFLPTHAHSKNKLLPRFLLESAMLIVALLTFSWYYVIGPLLLLVSHQPLLVQVAHIAFPCLELLMISCLILFVAHVPRRMLRLAVSLFSAGFMVFLVGEFLRQYAFIHNTEVSWWQMLCWIIGCFLFAPSAQLLRRLSEQMAGEKISQQEASMHSLPLWRLLLPYLFLPAVLGLIFYVWSSGNSLILPSIGTYCGGLLLLILIFIRQLFALRETHQLNARLNVANNRLETLATTDPLTGLPNHRALMAELADTLGRAERQQSVYALLFFDLDHFKALNDGYGHATGDEILIAFSHLIQQQLRTCDIMGRWGGEEFLAILPETTQEEAWGLAERLREVVNQQTFAIAGGLHLTCSMGMACYPQHATDINALVNAADQAMYAAKRLGRNQVRQIDDPLVQQLFASEHAEGDREQTALQGFVKALTAMAEEHHPSLAEHENSVAELVGRLATRLGVSSHERTMMVLAGQLHDIGKVSIPASILEKPALLTQEEWHIMKKHPAVGAEIVSSIPSLRPLAPVIRAHHERWDGMGYPDQLQGEAIPLAARILTVADSYMAMTAERPYQRARSSEDALLEIWRCSGAQFDPAVVAALADLLYTSLQKRTTQQLVA